MFRLRLVLGVAGVVVSMTCAAISSQAQNYRGAQSPDQKSRKVKQEPNKAFKQWIKEVDPILTPPEREAFDKLRTDEEREQFIGEFWRKRDPDPDTEENEYKDEYYERIAYANEHFTSGKPGWLTDRGRIYLRFGKPDEIESHPSGGQYQRAYWEGPGSATTYPFERWFYRHLPNGRSGAEIEFVDPTGSGEYRIALNPFEKEVSGLLSSSSPELRMGPGVPDYKRQQDSPFEVMDLMRDLEEPPPINRRDTHGVSADGPVIDDSVLSLEIKPHYFLQSDGKVITAFTIQTDNRELVFKDSGGLQMARLSIFGKVLSPTGRKIGAFEDSVETTATTSELAQTIQRKSVYAKAVLLAPGRYRLDLLVRDVWSGARAFEHFAFTVPKFDATKLEISSIVLAAKLESLKDQPGMSPFTIGMTKVVPNVSAIYHRGAPVGIYLQVYNAGIDQTTLRPAVDVEYAVLKDGKELSRQTEDWNGLSDVGARLTLARLIDTRDLALGEYEIQIRIRDQVTNQTLSPATRFTVVK